MLVHKTLISDFQKYLVLEVAKDKNWNLTEEELNDFTLVNHILSNEWASLSYPDTMEQLHKVITWGERNNKDVYVKYMKQGRFYLLRHP